jgi:hypothetical protein
MAEHLNQHKEPPMDPFNAMGKPIPPAAREIGYTDAKAMGLDTPRAVECVSATAAALERDKPYEAQAAAMRFLDLTGAYRLMAVLLCAAQAVPEPVAAE